MNTNKFRGEITDISAKQEALPVHLCSVWFNTGAAYLVTVTSMNAWEQHFRFS